MHETITWLSLRDALDHAPLINSINVLNEAPECLRLKIRQTFSTILDILCVFV